MGKEILIATRTPKGFPGGSGFHLKNMIEVLERIGHSVRIFHHDDGLPYDAVPSIHGFYKVDRIDFDVLIADYSWMCGVFYVIPNSVLKICFVHDLRCRIIPCLEKTGYKDSQGWTEEKEAKLLQKADILLVLNDEDAAFCKRMAPNAKIVRIGIALEPIPHDPAKEIPGRCIYAGSRNMENQYALEWFGKEVWPKVKEEIPRASLEAFMGYSENISEHYAKAQLAVAPHIMKGGLKIKVAEAFAHGHIVIGSKCAFDGFEDGSFGGFDEPQEMSKAIIRLLSEDSTRKFYRNSVTGINGYQERMTTQSAYGKLLEVLA